MNWLRSYSLYFAWLISLAGFFLSLYYSEVLGYEPCHLCWYQRIALFPLALLLGIAAYREERRFCLYGLVLAVAGELFALYQILESHFPLLLKVPPCGPLSPCSELLAFPEASAIGFALIGLFLWLYRS